MTPYSHSSVFAAIDYIEGHLSDTPALEDIADAALCSKFHLNRVFRDVVGVPLHVYLKRRRLTEAARLLAFSAMPILDIALESGYESQQAFSTSFKEAYKRTPMKFRRDGAFYPLQLPSIPLAQDAGRRPGPQVPWEIRPAEATDAPAWLRLARAAIAGFPCFDEQEHFQALGRAIEGQQAFIMRRGPDAAVAMIYRRECGSIEYLAVQPQFRGMGISRAFLELALGDSPTREVCISTFRSGDRADTGFRADVERLGFTARELLVEFGYPTQRFVMRSCRREATV